MKKIIVFGATGNVGSYVFKYAREFFDTNEFEVIASGRRDTAKSEGTIARAFWRRQTQNDEVSASFFQHQLNRKDRGRSHPALR